MGVLLVAAGGALGALARWALGPDATLLVNISGCFLIGVAMALIGDRPQWRLFLGTGFLGGYTTFSTYTVDAVGLLSAGRFGLFLWYVLATLAGALLATRLGLLAGGRLRRA